MADNQKKIVVAVEDRASRVLANIQRSVKNLAKESSGALSQTVLGGTGRGPGPRAYGELAKNVMSLEQGYAKAGKSAATFQKMMKELEEKGVKSQAKTFEAATKHVERLTAAYEMFAAKKQSILQKGVLTQKDLLELGKTQNKMDSASEKAVQYKGIALRNAPPGSGGGGEALEGFAAIGGMGGIAGILSKLAGPLAAIGVAVAAARFGGNIASAVHSASTWRRQELVESGSIVGSASAAKLGRAMSGDYSDTLIQADPESAILSKRFNDSRNIGSRIREGSTTTHFLRDRSRSGDLLFSGSAYAGIRAYNYLLNPEANRDLDVSEIAEMESRARELEATGKTALAAKLRAKIKARFEDSPELKTRYEAETLGLSEEAFSKLAARQKERGMLFDQYKGQIPSLAMGQRTLGGLFDRRFDQSGLGVQGNLSLAEALAGQVGVNKADGLMGTAGMVHKGYGLNLGSAAAFVGSMSNVAGGSNEGKQQVRDILAEAFAKGISDQKVLELLGGAVGEGVISAGGQAGDMRTAASLLSTVTAKYGGDMYAGNKAVSGMGYLNQQQSSYSQINRERLIYKALGGASPEAAMLSRLPYNDILNDTERFRALGGNDDIRKKILDADSQSRFQEVAEYNKPLYLRFRATGFDTSKLSDKDRRWLQGAASIPEIGGGSTTYDAVKAAMDISELGGKTGWGPGITGAGDKASLTADLDKELDTQTLREAKNLEAAKGVFEALIEMSRNPDMENLDTRLKAVASSLAGLASQEVVNRIIHNIDNAGMVVGQ